MPEVAHWLRPAAVQFAPPPALSLSEWADRHYRLSGESSSEPGPWHTRPYQREIMDSMTDPRCERVTIKKSARVGATLMVTAWVGFHLDLDPTSMLMVQPKEQTAGEYAKEFFFPMMRDCPQLSCLKKRKGSATILETIFENGGLFSLVGANAPSGLSGKSRRNIILDETDRMPTSAGSEGDPCRLAEARSRDFWNRTIVSCSTPGDAAASRIEKRFHAGDQRYYHVPCPQCGHRARLVFRESSAEPIATKGHWMAWPEGDPAGAHYVCARNGCIIESSSKTAMVAAGEWCARKPFAGHASFHIWAAYSDSPNSAWGQIAKEFVAATKEGPQELKTVVNTLLGETWKTAGEAPDWEKLYARRERYPVGSVPAGVEVVTCGVDVQKDYLIYEVVGWGRDKQSWSIEIGEFPGPPSLRSTWLDLDMLLNRSFPGVDGQLWPIRRLAIDSGAFTQDVYNFVRRHAANRVIATKGSDAARVFVGISRPTDVTVDGRTIKNGVRYWPVGVSLGKEEFYGWLNLPLPDEGASYPGGWCHHPEYGRDYFKQITAEQQVEVKKTNGFIDLRWHRTGANHLLDCRIAARAAAASLGLDRLSENPLPAKPKKRHSRWIERQPRGWLRGR